MNRLLPMLRIVTMGCAERISDTAEGSAAVCTTGDRVPVDCGTTAMAPSCCNAEGGRVDSARCEADAWACAEGALCECNAEKAAFQCTDFCGSDVFMEPTCTANGWDCGGLIRTDACPADTCWGLPGECPPDALWTQCLQGRWSCTTPPPCTEEQMSWITGKLLFPSEIRYGKAVTRIEEVTPAGRLPAARQEMYFGDEGALPIRLGLCGPTEGRHFEVSVHVDLDWDGIPSPGDLATPAPIALDLAGERCPVEIPVEPL
jgi:hypothetical protein